MIDDSRVLADPKLLLVAWTAGSAGTALELLLLGHFEEITQIVPLVLLTAAIATASWAWPARASVSALRWLMVFVVSTSGSRFITGATSSSSARCTRHWRAWN